MKRLICIVLVVALAVALIGCEKCWLDWLKKEVKP